MIFCTIFSVVSVLVYTILTYHPFENATLNTICCAVSLVLYVILMQVADGCYDKLKSRIKALEDKLNDKENSK